MNLPQLDATCSDSRLARSVSWWDSDAECTLVMSQPSIDRDLWLEYLRGAERSYRKHGVERALDVPAIRAGNDTVMFWVTIDKSGRVVGGVRATGPLQSPDDSHAVIEWAGRPGLSQVRKMIADRAPFGVVEMKTAWVTDDSDRNRDLAKTLARSALPTMALLDVQFLLATAARHVLDLWRSSGGMVASKIPATPYPDERYRTKMMWWDRSTIVNHAEPKQLSKMLIEMAELNEALNNRASVLARSGSPV